MNETQKNTQMGDTVVIWTTSLWKELATIKPTGDTVVLRRA